MDRLDPRPRDRRRQASTRSPGGMLETAENLRREYGITREEQDELAVRSHQRAVAAHEAGRFADELVPVDRSRHARQPDSSSTATSTRAPTPPLESLAALRPSGSSSTPRRP